MTHHPGIVKRFEAGRQLGRQLRQQGMKRADHGVHGGARQLAVKALKRLDERSERKAILHRVTVPDQPSVAGKRWRREQLTDQSGFSDPRFALHHGQRWRSRRCFNEELEFLLAPNEGRYRAL